MHFGDIPPPRALGEHGGHNASNYTSQYMRMRLGTCQDAFVLAGRVLGELARNPSALAATSAAACQEACTLSPACRSASWSREGRVATLGVTSQCWLSTSCRQPDCCFSGWHLYAKRQHGEASEAGEAEAQRRSKPSESCRAKLQAKTSPPSLAVCVLGAARSFGSPLMLASLRQQFIDPLSGGEALTRARVFALLKTRDDRKSVEGAIGRHHSFEAHADTSSSLESLAAALESEWLLPILGEAVILDGSGSYDGLGWVPTDEERRACRINASGAHARQAVRSADEATWRLHKSSGQSSCASRQATMKLDATLAERILKNLVSFSWCASAITRHEAASGQAFEVVAYTRPDLLRLEPVRPWCDWTDLQSRIVACPLPAHDGYFITPRKHARALLTGQLEAFISCNDTTPFYHVRGLRHPVPTSCCFSAESVLHHVSSPLPRDPSGCTTGFFVFLRQIQRAGWAAHHGSRTFRHVCDVVLSAAYTRAHSSFPKAVAAQLGGVAPEAGLALFTLFGNDTAACRAALRPYDTAHPPQTRAASWQPFPPVFYEAAAERRGKREEEEFATRDTETQAAPVDPAAPEALAARAVAAREAQAAATQAASAALAQAAQATQAAAAAAQPFVSQIGDPPLARFISEMETLRTTISNLSREVNALNEWKARMLAAYMPSPN